MDAINTKSLVEILGLRKGSRKAIKNPSPFHLPYPVNGKGKRQCIGHIATGSQVRLRLSPTSGTRLYLPPKLLAGTEIRDVLLPGQQPPLRSFS